MIAQLADTLRQEKYAGLTSEEKLAAYQGDMTTHHSIPLAELVAYLRTYGIERRLKAIVDDSSRPSAVREGLSDFLAHCADARQVTLATNTPAVALQVAQVLGYLLSVGDMMAEQAGIIYAMGGGRIAMPGVTLENIQAAEALIAEQDQQEARIAQMVQAKQDAIQRARAGAQRVIALWDAYDAAVQSGQDATAPTAAQEAAAFAGE